GIAARPVRERAQAAVGGRAQSGGDQVGDGLVRQRAQAEQDGATRPQVEEQPIEFGSTAAGTAREDPARAGGGEPVRRRLQREKRRRIGPLEIVQYDQQRGGAGPPLQRGPQPLGRPVLFAGRPREQAGLVRRRRRQLQVRGPAQFGGRV